MRYCIDPECIGRENPDDAVHCQACQTSLVVQGRYSVVKSLRQDPAALSEIFLVTDLQDNYRQKVLKTLITTNPKAYQLFEQEQSLLKTFGHPGIPRGEASFSVRLGNGRSLPCLVMEYVEGIDLEQWLQRHGSIDQKQAIPWLRQLADILNFIHQRNFFHRDIKPANIMRRHTGQMALIDFGTVREIDQTNPQGQKLTILGTPGYTAPEQWQGEAVMQSDFYALGMTFVHLLTGLHPDQHQPRIQEWRRKAVHALDPAFADLIDHLIDPNPHNRPADAATLLYAIDALTNPIPNPTRAVSAGSLNRRPESNSDGRPVSRAMSRPETKKRYPVLLLGVVALLGLTGAVFVVGSGLRGLFAQDVCDTQTGDHISCGEEVLVSQFSKDEPAPVEKQQGIAEFQRGQDYERAYELLNIAWDKQRDPETLIYRNNAWIRAYGIKNQPLYTIAIVAPLSTPDGDNNVGLMQLRGIAQLQDKVIKERNMNLQVMIVDDGNQKQQAQNVAEKLVKKSQLMAVIGHYASEVTISVVPIYQEHQLVLLSAAAVSAELSKQGSQPDHVFFRTVNTTQDYAQTMVRFMNEKAPNQKFAVFYSPGQGNTFSKSMRDEFVKLLPASQLVATEYDLSGSRFNAKRLLEEAQAQGATAIALFPDGYTNPYSIQNALDVISDNQSKLWIVGSNTLHTNEVLTQTGQQATQRFAVVAIWHMFKSADPDFPEAAIEYWRGSVSGQAAHAYDAGQVFVKALKQNPRDRKALRDILADPNFRVEGVTGTVSFNGSDRREQTLVTEKVVPVCADATSHGFVPFDFDRPCLEQK